ncbi:TlpA disulfide reductase family protein [Solwaraspora sp. WMMA2056]|uniref:TlpA family protein disulfide reductase n=1 Tax=Solwaraspora sp. WMMA2056 TaxID=3015161 RepID=UPI00259BF00A|nr:TlpA disulfide reductase family protein [Solwaraspora sp. WMMA2056]WJK41902.1 TlpA disulfide reductase family protein [Solwaraspora sp. WMMA2056]
MRVRRASVVAAVVAVLALTGCGAASDWATDCDTDGQGVIRCVGDDRPPAPQLELELLDGGTLDAAALRGQVVVINFWGSWCPPCRAEAADLEAIYQATRDRGVAFVGVNVRDERDRARAFERGRVTYPSLFDPASRLALDFNIPPNSIPATMIVDRNGRIAVVIREAVRQDDLQPLVEQIVAEPIKAEPVDG